MQTKSVSNLEMPAIPSFQYAFVKKIGNHWKSVFASVVAALGSLAIGANAGYVSTAIPDINSHRNSFRVDPTAQSWIVSLAFLPAIPGALLSGWIMDRVGRRRGLMMGAIPSVLGWIVITAARNVVPIFIGRIVIGFSVGLTLPIIEVYISEIAPPEIRGLLMSIHELGVNIGFLFAYVVGTFIPWNWLAITCASFSSLQAILLTFVPETPRWSVMHGQMEAARISLDWLRGETSNHDEEISAISESIKLSAETVPWLDYVRPPLRKCFFVSQFLFVLQELSGINVIRMYTVSIFQASGSRLDSNTETIIIGVILVVGSCVCTSIVDRYERHTMLLISSVTVGVNMAALGAFFVVKDTSAHTADRYLYWLPLLSMVASSVGFCLGCGPLPYVVTSELFSTRARGKVNSLGVATLCLFGFLTTKFFVNVSVAIGQAGAFFICAGICFLGAVTVHFTVPKTKGKMLESIQQGNPSGFAD